jgi:hypothetical protein
MRHAVVGGVFTVAILAGLVMGWLTTSSADAQRPVRELPRSLEDSALVALSTDVNDGRTQLTLIDPETRALVVYHIDKTSGEVSLRSVRNFHWDMQMDEFNGKNPLPREIRSLLQTR